MSTVFNDHSSNTERQVRDVIATATGTEVPNYRAARSLWTQTTVPYDTPPNTTVTTWVFS